MTRDNFESVPVLDAQVIERLRVLEEFDTPGFLAELAQMFLADGPGRIAAVHAGVDGADGDAIHRAGHAMKGSCSTMGATRLAAIAEAIETAGVEGDIARAADLVESLEEEYRLFAQALLPYTVSAE